MILICTNPYRDSELQKALEMKELLSREGFESCICPIFYDKPPESLPQGVEICSFDEEIGSASVIIVIGGDGTILTVARMMNGAQIPILGINLGTKGFMTALEPEEIAMAIKAARGEMTVSRRMKLDVTVERDGDIILTDCALNDAVIHGYGDCIRMEVFCNGDQINSISGDGLILATPTGSTGYSMSAGGPIVEPDAENIIMSPICAHSMGSRSFVFGPDRTVKVRVERLTGRRAYLSVDGNSVLDIKNNDIVTVKRSHHCTLMASLGLRSFYEIAYEKLR